MIFLLVSLGLFALIITFVVKKLIENPEWIVFESENHYLNPLTQKLEAFSEWQTESTVYLSVIIPAYNEEERLPKMLEECLPFLEKHYPNNYEVIIVNDGSSDRTNLYAIRFVTKLGCDCVRLLTLERNRGKGGAVKMGMERARGSLLLFADADGATKFSELAQLETEILQNEFDSTNTKIRFDHRSKIDQLKRIVIGSRAHLEEQSKSERSLFRTFLMHGFHLLVNVLVTGKDIRDTQCGFKLFTRHTAAVCFANLHIQRWAFDVELLYIAKIMKFNIKEVAVHWTEIDGSKVTPVISWIQMGMDLLLIWAKYFFGVWKIDHKHF